MSPGIIILHENEKKEVFKKSRNIDFVCFIGSLACCHLFIDKYEPLGRGNQVFGKGALQLLPFPWSYISLIVTHYVTYVTTQFVLEKGSVSFVLKVFGFSMAIYDKVCLTI